MKLHDGVDKVEMASTAVVEIRKCYDAAHAKKVLLASMEDYDAYYPRD